MSQIEKLISRMKTCPRDFKYTEMKRIMEYLGYAEQTSGNGSAVNFKNLSNESITVHKPHPSDEVAVAALKRIVRYLVGKGLI